MSTPPSSSEMAAVKKLPDQHYMAIEFPGIVKNLDRAMVTLGGASSVLESHKQKQSQIPLNFRPDDPWSHPIFLDRILTCNFLLEVTETVDEHSGKTTTSGDIVGLIPCTYMAKGLADFQYLAPPVYTDPDPQTQQSVLHGNGDSTTVSFPPPIFSKSDQPHRWNFEPNPLFKLATKIQGGQEVEYFKDKKTRPVVESLVANLQFESPEVPIAPPAEMDPHVNMELLPKLETFFAGRNIVARSFLEWTFHEYSTVALTATAYRVAYQFSSGPWRWCWVRLGYDPKSDPGSRELQIIGFRTEATKVRGEPTGEAHHRKKPTDKPARGASRKDYINILQHEESQRTNRRLESCFRKPPSQKQVVLWLPDIVSVPGIAEALATPYTEVCDKQNGWFTAKANSQIRSALKVHLDLLVTEWDEKYGPSGMPSSTGDNGDEDEMDSEDEDLDQLASQPNLAAENFFHAVGRNLTRGDASGMDLDQDDEGEFELLGDDDDDDDE